MIEITDETYPAIMSSLAGLTKMVLQATAAVDLATMRSICGRFQTIAPVLEPTTYQNGGDLNLHDQAAVLAALDRFVTDVRKLDRSEAGR